MQRVENRKCVQNYLFLYENEYIIYLQNEKAFKF
nr:MAG TPA: hypothetical protein [Caudoviricetes sp.]